MPTLHQYEFPASSSFLFYYIFDMDQISNQMNLVNISTQLYSSPILTNDINQSCNPILLHIDSSNWTISFTTLFILTSILGIIQNATFILLVIKRKLKLTQINILFALMSLNDLLISVVIIPIHVLQIANTPFGLNCILDLVRILLSGITFSFSFYLTCYIAYHRYRHVKHLHNFRLDNTEFTIELVLIMVLAICVPLIRLIPFKHILLVYVILVVTIGFFIFAILFMSYITLLIILKRHPRRRDRDLNMGITILLTIYCLSMTPIMTYHVFLTFLKSSPYLLAHIYLVSIFCTASTCFLNPFIYHFTNQRSRLLLKEIFAFFYA